MWVIFLVIFAKEKLKICFTRFSLISLCNSLFTLKPRYLQFFTSILYFFIQYGPIVEIDLKIPPRPPVFAFVEVNYISDSLSFFLKGFFSTISFHNITPFLFHFSLKIRVMLKMRSVDVMAISLMVNAYELVNETILNSSTT